ncbi:MAG TPA: 2-C-methyl-D-erythritol 4-phosphate cytidylyltransferase [Deltaproteobacteria bacterium]|nr:2-C-methyl-D-erythritol 4-phosphate cytidylyltransferase [Deltaproteobacteria bacterium]
MKAMKTIVIIAAGGRGHRMGESICKQFLELKGMSIIARTILKFQTCEAVDGIIIGITTGEEDYFKEKVLLETGETKLVKLVSGGEERQDTVWNCLEVLPESCEIVLVHDGVRPLISEQLIEKVAETASEKGAVIPALPAEETTKKVSDGVVIETLNRKEIWLAQTPQGFRRDLIVEAYKKARKKQLRGTDDASLVEALGRKVYVVKGEKQNMKITTPFDLKIALRLLEDTDRKIK